MFELLSVCRSNISLDERVRLIVCVGVRWSSSGSVLLSFGILEGEHAWLLQGSIEQLSGVECSVVVVAVLVG